MSLCSHFVSIVSNLQFSLLFCILYLILPHFVVISSTTQQENGGQAMYSEPFDPGCTLFCYLSLFSAAVGSGKAVRFYKKCF